MGASQVMRVWFAPYGQMVEMRRLEDADTSRAFLVQLVDTNAINCVCFVPEWAFRLWLLLLLLPVSGT